MFIATILYIKVQWYSEKNVATKLSGWATKKNIFFCGFQRIYYDDWNKIQGLNQNILMRAEGKPCRIFRCG